MSFMRERSRSEADFLVEASSRSEPPDEDGAGLRSDAATASSSHAT